MGWRGRVSNASSQRSGSVYSPNALVAKSFVGQRCFGTRNNEDAKASLDEVNDSYESSSAAVTNR